MDKNLFEKLKSDLNQLTALEGLRLISREFGTRAVFSTSFGMEDQVITHLISENELNIEIFTLDTGRLFQETYDVFELTRSIYKINIKTYYPDSLLLETFVSGKGPNSFYESVENRKGCCHIRKVEPLGRALKDKSIWITGLRRDQSPNRSQVQLFEYDEAHSLMKYNPIIEWNQQEVESFIDENSIPVNVLHKRGFPSIGCAPCTRAIMPNEDPRAGRWWWEGSGKECGLHTH